MHSIPAKFSTIFSYFVLPFSVYTFDLSFSLSLQPSGEFRTNESGLFIVYIQSWVREKGKHVNLTCEPFVSHFLFRLRPFSVVPCLFYFIFSF